MWVTSDEVRRVAEHLNLTSKQVLDRYCRKVMGRISFGETVQPNGDHDCIFLKHIEPPKRAGKTNELAEGEAVPLPRKVCSIYEVRPLQCRTWPFWPENVESRETWDHAAQRCHGMNHGRRQFTAEQIEALRDATEWPHDPPTSSRSATGKRV